ncbi:hypothetical protein PAECIP111891_00602 [Paenibacillus allorhizoplanae]|uniref:Uncharacterized protein n=1 Tax=Paenibacillus allorhizoplanae TaxID=2905648 RepID=A0ABM9BU82_9BACL|nr:hypothetical protein PAECIP111891_00602 [Paenibacillus allorhizoplanae]
MESTERITGNQLCLLVFSFIAPTLILVVPSLMEKISHQDAWMTIFFPAFLIGALQVWIMIALSKRYPANEDSYDEKHDIFQCFHLFPHERFAQRTI